MKIFRITLGIVFILSGCAKDIHQFNSMTCKDSGPNNIAYSKADTLSKLIAAYVEKGIPGISLAVYSDSEGWWEKAAGYSSIENKISMQPCHLQYIQSVTKTYMATAVLKLREAGKIVLDTAITAYLPEKYSSCIANSNSITIRMLLNHTSGIAEFTEDAGARLYLLQHPTYIFPTTEYLQIVKKQKPKFNPGEKYSYTNTNYDLLALIVDAITGDHANYIQDKILIPLGLINTHYRKDVNYLQYSNLVNSYLDRFSNGILENVTTLQQSNVASLIGDDGIVATPADALRFFTALMTGKVLTPSSMQEMQRWVNDDDGKPVYGMGLFNLTINGEQVLGHGGGGLGAGCEMYFLPKENTYVFMAVNLGVLVDGPIVERVNKLKDAIVSVLQH